MSSSPFSPSKQKPFPWTKARALARNRSYWPVRHCRSEGYGSQGRRKIADAFKKAIEHPSVVDGLAKYDMVATTSSEDYKKFVTEVVGTERKKQCLQLAPKRTRPARTRLSASRMRRRPKLHGGADCVGCIQTQKMPTRSPTSCDGSESLPVIRGRRRWPHVRS